MASWRKAILFGFLIWLIPFVVAFSLFSIRESWRALFESVMPVVVTLVVVAFGCIYFRQVRAACIREGLLLGLLWLFISVAVDLPLMLSPPMNMTIANYAADVGLTYLIMPIVTTGMGVVVSAALPVSQAPP